MCYLTVWDSYSSGVSSPIRSGCLGLFRLCQYPVPFVVVGFKFAWIFYTISSWVRSGGSPSSSRRCPDAGRLLRDLAGRNWPLYVSIRSRLSLWQFLFLLSGSLFVKPVLSFFSLNIKISCLPTITVIRRLRNGLPNHVFPKEGPWIAKEVFYSVQRYPVDGLIPRIVLNKGIGLYLLVVYTTQCWWRECLEEQLLNVPICNMPFLFKKWAYFNLKYVQKKTMVGGAHNGP